MTDLKQVPSEWKEFLEIVKGAKWVLEIGTFRGQSALGLSKVVSNVISIDFEKRKIPRAKNCSYIIGDSKKLETVAEVKKIIGPDKLDVLFIDGSHKYDGVKSDFEMYSPLVKSKGVVALHDIVDSPKHRGKGCTVYKFWDEIKNNYKYKEIIHNGSWAGIGIMWL